MLASNKIIGFIAITDVKGSRVFYETKLGLDFVSDDAFATVFRSGGTMIRLQKVEKLEPKHFTVLGWEVPDIKSIAAELSARGVMFERYQGMEQDDLGIWRAPGGAKIAWFKDPDGNVLSLSQH
jgi:catechol 2,3-dioxygenase-like lactoylglutathione lyase family enzyme